MDDEELLRKQLLQGQVQSYRPQIQEATILKYRLDTEAVLSAIRTYLEGISKETVYAKDEKGQLKAYEQFVSNPKANPEGIHALMSFMQSCVNSPAVQGNFTTEGRYDFYIYEVNVSLVKMIVINCPAWEIADEDIEPICDFIMQLIIPFMSRLINNKERESYMGSLQSQETITKDRGGIHIPNPFKRGG